MTDDAETDGGWFSPEAATFGDRVAGARENRNISQTDLAKRLGVKLKTVRGWEDDLQEPRANKLQMLSGVLNVSLMWLLNGEGDGLSGPANAMVLPAELSELLTEMRQLKTRMMQNTDQLALLEKRLRATLKDQL